MNIEELSENNYILEVNKYFFEGNNAYLERLQIGRLIRLYAYSINRIDIHLKNGVSSGRFLALVQFFIFEEKMGFSENALEKITYLISDRKNHNWYVNHHFPDSVNIECYSIIMYLVAGEYGVEEATNGLKLNFQSIFNYKQFVYWKFIYMCCKNNLWVIETSEFLDIVIEYFNILENDGALATVTSRNWFHFDVFRYLSINKKYYLLEIIIQTFYPNGVDGHSFDMLKKKYIDGGYQIALLEKLDQDGLNFINSTLKENCQDISDEFNFCINFLIDNKMYELAKLFLIRKKEVLLNPPLPKFYGTIFQEYELRIDDLELLETAKKLMEIELFDDSMDIMDIISSRKNIPNFIHYVIINYAIKNHNQKCIDRLLYSKTIMRFEHELLISNNTYWENLVLHFSKWVSKIHG